MRCRCLKHFPAKSRFAVTKMRAPHNFRGEGSRQPERRVVSFSNSGKVVKSISACFSDIFHDVLHRLRQIRAGRRFGRQRNFQTAVRGLVA
jgi:hypothetical protein